MWSIQAGNNIVRGHVLTLVCSGTKGFTSALLKVARYWAVASASADAHRQTVASRRRFAAFPRGKHAASAFLSVQALLVVLIWVAMHTYQSLLFGGDDVLDNSERTIVGPQVVGSHNKVEAKGKPEAVEPMLRDNRVSGPYCGIYSLYACLSALGIDTKPETLVSTKYVGSFRGSTAQELIDAATDFGTQAEYYSHLTHKELAQVQTPMILHTRSTWTNADFSHWVAFLGCDGDRMRIVDAPGGLQRISPAELLANWDGSAIGISRKEIDQAFVLNARLDYVILFGQVLLATYLLRQWYDRETSSPSIAPFQSRVRTLISQVVVILGISFSLGMGYHAVSVVGFLRNPSALAEVRRRHFPVDIPEISAAHTEYEIRETKPIVLDARGMNAYRKGALPGARSMSAYSTLSERHQVLADVDKDKRIIVYCQSASCAYADEVARFLKFNGYTNVAIFRDGYSGWSQVCSATKAAP